MEPIGLVKGARKHLCETDRVLAASIRPWHSTAAGTAVINHEA